MKFLIPGEYRADLNGVDIYFSVRGEGPPLLTHYGGPGLDPRGWGHCAGLDRHFTLIIIHPRGSGLSGDAPDGAYSLDDYAADLEALRRHLSLDRPALLGWSHGGMVGITYAAAYPESLSALILYDTAAKIHREWDKDAAVAPYRNQPWFDDAYAALEAEWGGTSRSDEEMRRLWAREIKFYFHRFDAKAEAYVAETGHLPVRQESLQIFNKKEVPVMDLRPLLPKITAPTLVIVGRHDFITTVAMAETVVKGIPGARMEVFESSGHFAHIEEPDKFRNSVSNFLSFLLT